MRATLVSNNRVNLIENYCASGLQHPASAFTSQQDVERFRSSDDDMRWPFRHRRAFRRRGVACANQSADVHLGQSHCGEFFLNALERELKIALDVVAESFQWRHVDDVGCIVEFSFNTEPHEVVDCGKKCRESFS